MAKIGKNAQGKCLAKLFLLLVLAATGVFLYGKDLREKGSGGEVRSAASYAELQVLSEIPGKICDIRDYGAIAERKSTDAINAAIKDCAAAGGGSVIIPQGRFLSGAIRLESKINLFLAEGAEISFSTDLGDYLPVVLTRFQGMEFYNYAPLIYANGAQNVAITGKGKLIGNGDRREDWTGGGDFEKARQKLYEMSKDGVAVEKRIFGDKEPGLRPSFVQFVNCKGILLDGFSVENGPIWTIHPVYSENFTARNLTINTWSGNTDGIVIDSTKNVLIENSFFSAGDDAISIKSGLDREGREKARPSRDILIRNIEVDKGSSGVSIGSEMSGGVQGVEIKDSVFRNTRHGFRIKSTRSRGGYVRDVLVENVRMDGMSGDVLDLNLNYSSEVSGGSANKPLIADIQIRNIKGGENERAIINMDGMPNPLTENILVEEVSFFSAKKLFSLKNGRNMVLRNVWLEKAEEANEIENSQNITVEGISCQEESIPCLQISGGKSADIRIKGVFPEAGIKMARDVKLGSVGRE